MKDFSLLISIKAFEIRGQYSSRQREYRLSYTIDLGFSMFIDNFLEHCFNLFCFGVFVHVRVCQL